MFLYESVKRIVSKNKVLFKNFSSLTILQISQYIFPLITFPYLVRVLGPEGYGLVAFATAFVGYFTVITDYGFNLSATRDISINREFPAKMNEIFNSVMTVKAILFLGSTALFIPILYGFSKFSNDLDIYLITYTSVLGSVLFPVWFFQGIERMGFISAISIFVKILWVASIFLLVNSPDDIVILVTLNSLSAILNGIIGLLAVKRYFDIKFLIPSIKSINYQFKNSWHYFISNISVSLYTISNVFILGLFANNAVVGYFSAADKIRMAVQNLTSISGRTIFPHLSIEFKRSHEGAILFLKKYVKIIGLFTLSISILLFVFAEPTILIVLGENYYDSIILLKIMSALPFIIFLSNVAGIQTMLNLGYKKEFAQIILLAGIFNVVLSFIIVPFYLSIGSAVIVVLTELLVTSQMIIFLKRSQINLFKKEV